MSKKWYIYGAGGLGVETIDTLYEAMSFSGGDQYECEFVVDKPNVKAYAGYPIVDFYDALPGSHITIAVGEPHLRERLLNKVVETDLRLTSVISPKSNVSNLANIGDGSIIAVFCSIQATAMIGQNVSVNTSSVIGHDTVVSDNAVISSMVNLGGAAFVGAGTFIGMGALIKEGVKIGKSSIVGMGSVVYKDIPDNVIAVGNPARVVRRNEQNKVFGK